MAHLIGSAMRIHFIVAEARADVVISRGAINRIVAAGPLAYLTAHALYGVLRKGPTCSQSKQCCCNSRQAEYQDHTSQHGFLPLLGLKARRSPYHSTPNALYTQRPTCQCCYYIKCTGHLFHSRGRITGGNEFRMNAQVYSPECVEGKFCELRMYEVLRSWHRAAGSKHLVAPSALSARRVFAARRNQAAPLACQPSVPQVLP